MNKLLSIILVLQLLLVPAAASAQGEDEKSKQAGETISADFSSDSKPRLSLEGEANYQDPANYPLKNNGELIDILIDSYGVNHSTYFNNLATSTDDSEYMELSLLYRSNQSSPKDGLLTIEFFKEANNSLSYVGGSDFPVAWFTEATLSVDLQKSYFADQGYIYMRIGTSQSSSDTSYSDVTLFKVENPFASVNPSLPPDQYAVISNESVDAETAQSSGTFDVKDMKYTKDSSLKPGAYKVDYDKPFDSASNKGRLLEKNSKSIDSFYNVGDYKNFWVSNLTTNANEQINARLAYSGSKANVWVHNNEITDSDAEKLGIEFDSKIHSSVTNHFGPESDVNSDGKINILTYDIQDGFSGSGGYVAGYFWAGDLYNVSGSNMSEIFYIDTYPAMGMGSVKDVTSSYETLAHEFQHMVNFNRNALIEGGGSMDTWLNESLSMAAEQIYTGYGLEERVNYYNVSAAIQNGHSLLYWDRSGDTLSNYSLSYLFGQYIKIQAGIGDKIFKEILQDPNNDYAAVENAAKKYIDPNMTFGKLMTHFRIALLLKERDGLRGFKGDPFFDSLNEKIFNGNSVNLRGGGSVVTAFNSEEGFEEPAEKGADITYTILDMNETDITPPASPVVYKVGDSDSAITGTAEANATVYAIAGGSEIGSNTANQAGGFQLSISPQKAGTRIEVYAMDPSGNVSEPAIVTVEDVTAPGTPQVNNVTDQDSSITGTAEQNSVITVKAGTESWSGNVNTEGQFSVAIPKQKAGTLIEVTAKDAAGNVSEAAATTVVDKTPPAAPMVNKVTDQSMAVTGSAEKNSEVTVKIGTGSWKGTAGSEGNFSVSIPKQTAGTQIEVTAKDAAGNVSQAAKVTVVDGDIPVAPIVRKVTDQSTAVTGNAEVDTEINVKIGTASWKGITDAEGIFSVAIPKQKVGTIIEVTATDREGNVSLSAKVTVVDGAPPAAPTVNKVNDQSSTVTGLAEKGSEVIVKIGTSSWKGTANTEGQFAITIPKQKAGTIIEVTAKDIAGNVSVAAKVTVVDETAPTAPTVNKVNDQAVAVTGSAEKGTEIIVKIGSEGWKGMANAEGKFSVVIPKQQAGTVIEVTAKDAAGNVSAATKVTVVDETAPAAPTVTKVNDQATAVTGTAEKGSEVTVKIGTSSWKGTANTEGQFAITIPKQKAGTVIEVTAKDTAGNVSAATKVTVVDEIAPAAPTVNKVTDQSTTVTGSAEKGSEVTVKTELDSWKGTANEEGQFSVTILKQKAGTVIEVTAKDTAGNVSAATKVTVVDETAPAAPTVNKVTDQAKAVTGSAEKGAEVTVKIGTESWKGTANTEGQFSVEIPKQKAGTVMEVAAKDEAGNVSAATKVTVLDGTAPAAPTVNKVTDQSTAVTGSAERGAEVTVKIGTSSWKGMADTEGKFSITIPKQKAGTIVEVTAKDTAGNVSSAAKVTVTDDTPPAAPAVNTVSDRNLKIFGTAEPGSTISVRIGNSEIGKGVTGANGFFAAEIPAHPNVGTELVIIAFDAAGNASSPTKVKVIKGNTQLSKLVGKTRYTTAVEISKKGWSASDTVFLVNGWAIADGLTATPLASAKNAPILLAATNSLPDETMAEIKRLKAKNIVLIGGSGVISDGVKNNLSSQGYSVSQIGGKTRYETSLKVAQELDKLVDVHTAYMAYGHGEPDALSIAAQSGQTKQPIILTEKKAVPANTYQWLKGEGLQTSYFIGGKGVIYPAIITEMNSITAKSVVNNRLSGVNRQETNAKVIQAFYKQEEMPTIMVAHASTDKLVDALAAGPLAAKYNVPVLLVANKLDPLQVSAIKGKHANDVHQIGGGIGELVLKQVVDLMN